MTACQQHSDDMSLLFRGIGNLTAISLVNERLMAIVITD